MAVELEQTIMREIGLGAHYNWFNGSRSCGGIRRTAVNSLSSIAKKHGLVISPAWLKHCQQATQVDQIDGGDSSLTNTWVACSYAIQDAIYRKEGGENTGFKPDVHNWHFWNEEKRQAWERRQEERNSIHDFLDPDGFGLFKRAKR